jgi:hypothetical protein
MNVSYRKFCVSLNLTRQIAFPSDNSSSVRQGPGFDFPQGRFVSTGRVISDKNDAYGPAIRGHLKEGFLARFLGLRTGVLRVRLK